jgi:hypothetical protein
MACTGLAVNSSLPFPRGSSYAKAESVPELEGIENTPCEYDDGEGFF